MPTNEERKKIAENLKSFANGKTGVLDGVVDGLLGLRHDCRGSDRFTSESVLRLARIIEPEQERTCKWVWGEEWLESSPMGPRELQWANWYLNCGCWEGCEDEFEDFYDPYEEPKDHWKYCPNCGARVVE